MHVIPFFFQLQNAIKLYHWMTTCHARHLASDKLFSDIVSLSDTFTETFIGRYGRPKLSKKDLSIDIPPLTDAMAMTFLDQTCIFLTNDIMKFIKSSDTDLVNIRDEILGKVNQTKYLFTLQ